MAHVSKKRLKPRIQQEVEAQLIRSLFNSGLGRKILRELLTEIEQTMIAKRLAILLMLEEDFSYYRIARTLGVSISTIKRLHQQMQGDEFNSVSELASKKKERAEFWKMMELILRAGLPPMGKGRWQGINKLLKR